MNPPRLGAVVLAAALGLSVLAAAPASPDQRVPAQAVGLTTIAQADDAILAQLPQNAAEAGLAYAPRLVQVQTPTLADRNVVANSGLDATEHAGHDYVEVVLHEPAHEQVLADLGYGWTVTTPDLIALEHQRIMADAAYFRATSASPLPSGRTTYRVLADFEQEIDALVAANPNLVKRISLGTSVEGRDLIGVEIARDVARPDDGRPVFLMFGIHHAREWPSAEAPMEFIHDLVNDFNAGDARTVDLLARARAIIVPVSNPDGYDASRTSGDLIDLNTVEGGGTVTILATPGNAYKRKNCRIVDGQTQPAGTCVGFSSPGGYGIGIDLNRNYGALWGGPGTDGFPNTASPVYRGPDPFSEPETQAIRTLISTRQVTTLISNHTFSNLLLRPVGVQPNTVGPDGFPIGFSPDECFTAPDGSDRGMQTLGERMTAQTGYSNQFGWELYDTTGTTEDYSYNATGGYGYTFEIGPDQFHPPYEEVVAEYVGDTAAAASVTPGNAVDLTTATGRSCPGTPYQHSTVGGGLREAYYIALENAADAATHSVLTGDAPAGAEITVSRSGTFPLWDASTVEDTVTTTMTTTQDGRFEYHVNPSTRPFVASRPYTDGEPPAPVITPVTSDTQTGNTQPPGAGSGAGGTTDVPIEVGAGVQAIQLTLSSELPDDDYDLHLISPDLVPVQSSTSPSSSESILFVRESGLEEGQWVARIENWLAFGPWDLEIVTGTVQPGVEPTLLFSPGATEAWRVTCSVAGSEVGSAVVQVDRGATKDLGDLCRVQAAAAANPAPAPPPLPTTGGGLVLGSILALGAAVALRRRHD